MTQPDARSTNLASEASDIQHFADKLWQAADKLRGQVDAAEYKHVVLGLLYLKYISDAFDARRDQLKAELVKDGIPEDRHAALLENPDEYTAARIFWVPPASRWPKLQNQSTRPDIATLIADAILAVERDNQNPARNDSKYRLPANAVRSTVAG